jgi:hypothetical protein
VFNEDDEDEDDDSIKEIKLTLGKLMKEVYKTYGF